MNAYHFGLLGFSLLFVLQNLGIIHVLRQLRDWVGGFKKWQFLLTVSILMLIKWVGQKKSKTILT